MDILSVIRREEQRVKSALAVFAAWTFGTQMLTNRPLLGSWITSITEDGNLCLPKRLRKTIGFLSPQLYVTSTTGEYGRVYPKEAWDTIEEKLARLPSENAAKKKFLLRTGYWGTYSTLGKSGVELPALLRESAKLEREVIVIGLDDHLGVYSLKCLNEMVLLGRLKRQEIEFVAELDPHNTVNNSILAGIDLSRREELFDVLALCRKEVAGYIAEHADAVFDLRPRVFEIIIAEVMKSCGFEVELTAQTRDGGVDMIAVHKEVFGIATRYVIECKRWSRGRKVTIDLVRALYGAKEAHKADQAIYVTSATFTKHAWNISKTGQLRNVTLIDFEGLREWFETYLKSEAASRPSTSQDRRVLLT